jgi:hypothetical protein
MAYESVVAFDGAWSHRRYAKECIVILIDCGQNRIVDFEIKTKTSWRDSSQCLVDDQSKVNFSSRIIWSGGMEGRSEWTSSRVIFERSFLGDER